MKQTTQDIEIQHPHKLAPLDLAVVETRDLATIRHTNANVAIGLKTDCTMLITRYNVGVVRKLVASN